MAKKKERIAPESLAMPLTGVDSHAHLDSEEALANLGAIMAQATAAGVAQIGHIFLHPKAWRAHKEAFSPYPQVFFVLGIHPDDVGQCMGEGGDALFADMERAFMEDDRIKAVGEIGLDYYWNVESHEVQIAAFRKQLALARKLNKPVVIHSRNSADDTLRVLEGDGFAGYPVLWHCFSENAEFAARVVQNGWHIALTGAMTYNANAYMREALHSVPRERFLVETDSPYLSPEPWRGKPNSPALSVFTATCAAKELGIDPAEFWTLCGDNARRFFGLPERKA